MAYAWRIGYAWRRVNAMVGNEDDSDIPHSLQVLWGRAPKRTRGPQQLLLSRERIVAAAIQIADAEGLQALSMARLAERLGCAPMSLYRHVANKDELQVFMMDLAPGKPPKMDVAPRDWRGELERWARELRAVYQRHPWILQVTTGRPPLEPGQLAWLDAGLRTLSGTKLDPGDKLSTVLLLLYYVRGEAQITTSILQAVTEKAGPDNPKMQAAWYGRTLAKLIDPKRFPALAELVAAGTFGYTDDDATDFGFGLARILDGVERLIQTSLPRAHRRRRRRSPRAGR